MTETEHREIDTAVVAANPDSWFATSLSEPRAGVVVMVRNGRRFAGPFDSGTMKLCPVPVTDPNIKTRMVEAATELLMFGAERPD